MDDEDESSAFNNITSSMGNWTSIYDPLIVNITNSLNDSELIGEDGTSIYVSYKAPELIFTIQFYSLAVIIPIGLITNFLSVLVFITSCMRYSSTGHYLLALSCADFTVMVWELLTWLNTTKGLDHRLNIDFYDRYNVFCKGLSWLRYASRLVSAWLVVAITAERCVAIVRPFDVSRLSTPKRAKIVIASIVLMSIAISSYPLYTVAILTENEPGSSSFYTMCFVDLVLLYDVMTWIVLRVGDLILPSVLICALTSAIAIKLCSRPSARLRVDANIGDGAVIMRGTREKRINTMLLCIALTFVFIRLPRAVCYYLYYHRDSPLLDSWNQRQLHAAYLLTLPLYTVNYAINFFLYSLLGTAFRMELLSFCSRFDIRKTKRMAYSMEFSSIGDCELDQLGSSSRSRIYRCSDPCIHSIK